MALDEAGKERQAREDPPPGLPEGISRVDSGPTAGIRSPHQDHPTLVELCGFPVEYPAGPEKDGLLALKKACRNQEEGTRRLGRAASCGGFGRAFGR